MTRILLHLFIAMLCLYASAQSKTYVVRGIVTETDGHTPIEFASIDVNQGEYWCMTDQQGCFSIKMNHQEKMRIKASCIGYETSETDVAMGIDTLHLCLKQSNLMLKQVVVTATRKTEHATTSYLINRQALDNQQIINVSDAMTLMPGGKTVNSSLITDNRIALRAGDSEKGNAAFGTAIEVDGQRLQNNAEIGETSGASTRTISSTNVASIEVVPGIPSVEYGDLSNGIVKVSTKRGHTPWEITFSTNPHTAQVAVSKGFNLAKGVLNFSLEHARSYSSIASPHTAYQRNSIAINYRRQTTMATFPLILNFNLNGNVGGFNSKADPDQFTDTYSRVRDHVLRGAIQADWNPARQWLASLSFHADFSIADKFRTSQVNDNSSSSQAQIHATDAGYYIATDYDSDPQAPIILGPTGYWYVKSHSDNKPQSILLKIKAKWNQQNEYIQNRMMAGAEWTATRNRGRGRYYDDMRYAPTWREYRYNELPTLHNVALYAEDRFSVKTSKNGGEWQLMAGVRSDITHVGQSAYGTVASISPRFNTKYIFWQNQMQWFFNSLNIYAGWGKSVKLPSFEVLYPAPAYADRIAFTPASTADNKAFYAYSITPFKPIYNPNLKWQHSHQLELGLEAETRFATFSLSAFFAKTCRPYLRKSIYTPFSYNFTSQSALENNFPIPSGNRIYSIDRSTGQVTVTDRFGAIAPQLLPFVTRNTFNVNSTYTNGSDIYRSGIDWILDFKQIPSLHTSLRIDGSYYHYHGVDNTLIAAMPSSAQYMSDGVTPYQFVGYYEGTALGGGSSYATVPNGSLTNQVNNNFTIITHIPAIRLVISLRIETTLFDSRRALSEGINGISRGYVIKDPADYFGTPYTGNERDQYVALWPQFYSTWDNPNELIPFAERFIWARDNDRQLFNELAALVVKTNYNYNLNPDRISAYVSGNINITKEIGDHVSISFLANNFWNSMARIKSRQTGLRSTIYNAGYIPPFYYGLSVRIKL